MYHCFLFACCRDAKSDCDSAADRQRNTESAPPINSVVKISSTEAVSDSASVSASSSDRPCATDNLSSNVDSAPLQTLSSRLAATDSINSSSRLTDVHIVANSADSGIALMPASEHRDTESNQRKQSVAAVESHSDLSTAVTDSHTTADHERVDDHSDIKRTSIVASQRCQGC
jgi:hypothetical protein